MIIEGLRTLLDRPLAFLDLETTGTNTASDRIVEIAVLLVRPDEEEVYRSVRRLNPGVPIPAEATAVHGISDADVADQPTFHRISKALWQLLDPCDLAGFNLRRFDLPLLRAEFRRCGMELDHTTRRLIDLQTVFFREQPRDLAAAARIFAGVELGAAAHSAGADTDVLPAILVGQLERYPHLPRSIEQLHAYCDEFQPFQTEVNAWFGDDLDEPVFQRGKNVKGKTLRQVIAHDPGFISWMMGKDDIEEEVKDFIRAFRRHLYGAA